MFCDSKKADLDQLIGGNLVDLTRRMIEVSRYE